MTKSWWHCRAHNVSMKRHNESPRPCPDCGEPMEVIVEASLVADSNNWWRQCLRSDMPQRGWDAIIYSEVERRCFWALLEWAETGEASQIGGFLSPDVVYSTMPALYWDPIQGFTGEQGVVDIISIFRRMHP